MDNPTDNRPVSSTVEESSAPLPIAGAIKRSLHRRSTPSLTIDATYDASHRAPNTLRSRSSSSSSSSSFSSISDDDIFDARNRQFPPILPSAHRPSNRPSFLPPGSNFARQLAKALPPVDTSNDDADSVTKGSSESEEDDEESEDNSDGSDSDEEEDNGENGDSVEEEDGEEDRRVQALWIKLRDQRTAVRELRLELSDRRKRSRELRTKKDDADNGFMGLVRAHVVTGNLPPSLGDVFARQFEVMQKARNDYQNEEADVEQLEDRLDQEELYREILETQFFTILYGAAGGNGEQEVSPSGSVAGSYAPPSRASLLGIPADRPVDIHPLYKQLLDAVGDRELAKEHYTELMAHRDSILYDLQMTMKRERLRDAEGRPDKLGAIPGTDDMESIAAIAGDPEKLNKLMARYGTSVDSDSEEFLRDFPEEEVILKGKLEEIKGRVDRLRQLCIDKGFMRKNLPYHEEYTIFSDTGEPFSAENMSINQEQVPRREEPLADLRFPILLSNPRHVLELETPKTALKTATRLPNDDPTRPHQVAEAMKEYGISTLLWDTQAEDKSDYINRWLLQRLRISPLEVELLYTVFSSSLKVRNIRRWQEDVLYYWSRDDGNKPNEVFEGPATMMDHLVIDDDVGSEKLNSVLGSAGHPEIEAPETTTNTSGPRDPESPPSDC
jgi:hypothetical protein